MPPHPLAKICWAKLIRFYQIWLDLGEINAVFTLNGFDDQERNLP